jgi:ATP-dependent Lon protease
MKEHSMNSSRHEDISRVLRAPDTGRRDPSEVIGAYADVLEAKARRAGQADLFNTVRPLRAVWEAVLPKAVRHFRESSGTFRWRFPDDADRARQAGDRLLGQLRELRMALLALNDNKAMPALLGRADSVGRLTAGMLAVLLSDTGPASRRAYLEAAAQCLNPAALALREREGQLRHPESELPATPAVQHGAEGSGTMQAPVHCVYDTTEVRQAIASLRRRYKDSDELASKRTLLDSMLEKGGHRRLATVVPDWRERLAEAEDEFPNFAEVLDFLRTTFAIAEYADGVPQIPPVLLDGPPGVGKTRFAQSITRLVRSRLEVVRMENAQCSILLGSDASYSNAKAGRMFEVLVEGEHASPVFLLDELCKVTGDERFSPVSALYMLLEADTASRIHDNAHPEIALDASRCIFICTSNDYRRIPAPVLSRLRLFTIPSPTPLQARDIAGRMFAEMVAGLPPALRQFRIADDALDALATVAPRAAKNAIREGIGRALWRKSFCVAATDLPATAMPARRPVGFV